MASPRDAQTRQSYGTPDSGFDHEGHEQATSSRSSRPRLLDSANNSGRSSGRSTGLVPDVTRFTEPEAEVDTDQQSVADEQLFDHPDDTAQFSIEERAVGARSPLTQRTNEERKDVRQRRYNDKTKSLGSESASPALMSSMELNHSDDPHWSSTPLQAGTRIPSRAASEPIVGETSILNDTNGRRISASFHGRESSDNSHFDTQLRKATEPRRSSTASSRSESSSTAQGQEFLGRVPPLRETFPDQVNSRRAQRSVPPSKSTRYPAHVLKEPTDLRRAVLKRDAAQNAPSPISESSASSDSQETPVTRPRPAPRAASKGRDGRSQVATCSNCVKTRRTHDALQEQLSSAIIHMDCIEGRYKTRVRKFIEEHDEALASLDAEWQKLEEEKLRIKTERADLDGRQMRVRDAELKQTRIQRNQTSAKNKEEAEAEAKRQERMMKISTENSSLRTKLANKEKEIKDLNAKLETVTKSKETATRTLDLKTKNHAREIQAKDKEIKELLQQQSAGQARRPGITPRKAIQCSPQPLANVSNTSSAASTRTSTPKEVSFGDTSTRYFDNSATSSEGTDVLAYDHDVDVPRKLKPRVQKGDCWVYNNQFASVNVFQIQHEDGSSCGALQYDYASGQKDTRWVYKDIIEVYHYRRHRVLIDLKPLGIKVSASYYGTQIWRPDDDITQYNYAEMETIEVMKRRDGRGKYAIVYDLTKCKQSVKGNSDRSRKEDDQVIRRGTLDNPLEHMDIHPTNPSIVIWKSHEINERIVDYEVKAHGADRVMKTKITLSDGKKFSISFDPKEGENWVLIEHLEGRSRYPCCDSGHFAREREQKGIHKNCDRRHYPQIY